MINGDACEEFIFQIQQTILESSLDGNIEHITRGTRKTQTHLCLKHQVFVFVENLKKKCFVYENASIVDVEYGPILVWEMETIFFVQFYLNPVEV